MITTSQHVCYGRTVCGGECWGPDCPHYRPIPDHELLYRKCRFAGQLWTVVYVNSGYVYLTSIDGKQHKRNIAVTEIQLIDEFADPYPEE